ncbi:MAG: alpha/beta hydrolase domain-containing protein [Candidatus Acidiferrales bacterium]
MRTLKMMAVVTVLLLCPSLALAEVVSVSISSRSPVADGHVFGSSGAYEKLTGTIEFALDPRDVHNAAIADLDRAQKDSDGRVHFKADLYVLQPTDPRKGNGVLLFEVSNRGRKGLLALFNDAAGSADPSTRADFGNGFLMREGYTLIWVGWEFDVAPPLLHLEAPLAAGVAGPITLPFIPDSEQNEFVLADAPLYPPKDPDDPAARLTVRDRFWNQPVPIPRGRWRFVPGAGAPRITLDGGFMPGRIYEVTYVATGARVVGAGLAAIRDAASAFRYRSDLPIHGRSSYAFGMSQDGRFLREFLYDGFNADEHNRRVFDAVWAHIAGASRGSFNRRFGTPIGLGMFRPTQFPFSNDPETYKGRRDGLLARYHADERPKVFYTNTAIEYWGFGRAAALIHTSPDGQSDLKIPEDERIYLLAGTEHVQAAFPPKPGRGQQLPNQVPQHEVMRALLRGLHEWASKGVRPPESRYPKFADGTLTQVPSIKFPAIPGVADPRTIVGPALVTAKGIEPLPFLVSQVDADGNELAGIRVPDITVPMATNTGWNFRSPSVGNPGDIVMLLGSWIPFPISPAERAARHDPRLSIEERYHSRDEYLQELKAAAEHLVQDRYLLDEDVPNVMRRGEAEWDFLMAH